MGEYAAENEQCARAPGMLAAICRILAPAHDPLLRMGFDFDASGLYWALAGMLFVPVFIMARAVCDRKKK